MAFTLHRSENASSTARSRESGLRPELMCNVVDEKSELLGHIVIDSTIGGRCSGGVRMMPDVSLSETAGLARAMTLKYGFAHIPMGGAKAGIVGHPDSPPGEKRKLLTAFGRALTPFLKTGYFVPGPDMGTTPEDIELMLASAGKAVQGRPSPTGSDFYTSVTVLAGATRAAQHIGMDLAQSTLAIEGFGKVGSWVGRVFSQKGTRVVAISTAKGAIYNDKGLDLDRLVKVYHQVGSGVVEAYGDAEQIETSNLLELQVDVLSPCAGCHSITSNNAGRVAARIICPGANAPITPEAESILFQRGILSIPDFVANCGGVLGISMKRTGLKEDFIRGFLEQQIGQQVTEVIQAAEKENVIPRVCAERIAEERFLRAKAAAEKRNIIGRAFSFALELYRRGIIPYQLVTPIAAQYFSKRFR